MAFKNAAINGETAMLSNFDIVKEYTRTITELQIKNDLKKAIIEGLVIGVILTWAFIFFGLVCR